MGTEFDAEKADQFSTVAPVYLQSFTRGDLKNFGLEHNLAKLVGREEVFEALNAKYEDQLAQTQQALPVDLTGKTYLLVLVTDQLSAIGNGAGVTQALDNLGLVRFALTEGDNTDEPPLMLKLNPESFGQMNPDILLFMGSWAREKAEDRGEDAIKAAL